MKKKKLRENMLRFLKKIPPNERKDIEDQHRLLLTQQSYWQTAKTIGLTISQDIEWDTRAIIEKAWEEGKDIAVPKCIPKTKEMEFYLIHSFEQLEKAHFDIMEPIPKQTKKINKNSINLLVVPGLVFDRKGYRIGFGGGYYDRFLSDFNNQTVSLLSSYQLKDRVPTEKYDLPVQNLITEKGAIKVFGGE